MSKKHKKQLPSDRGGQTRPAGNVVSQASGSPSEDVEPVAEQRPVPVWLIPLLVSLVYLADMYVMDHGADVMGKSGPFPKLVYDPFRTYQEVVDMNPETEEDKLLKIGREKYGLYCSPCHQPSGLGTPATGIPPLLNSEWVKTPGPGRAIRIVLHAIRGPITVDGKVYDNPGMLAWAPALTDEDIAAILSYVRANNEWGNKASFVKPEAVKKVRDQYGSREPWSADEVSKIPETE